MSEIVESVLIGYFSFYFNNFFWITTIILGLALLGALANWVPADETMPSILTLTIGARHGFGVGVTASFFLATSFPALQKICSALSEGRYVVAGSIMVISIFFSSIVFGLFRGLRQWAAHRFAEMAVLAAASLRVVELARRAFSGLPRRREKFLLARLSRTNKDLVFLESGVPESVRSCILLLKDANILHPHGWNQFVYKYLSRHDIKFVRSRLISRGTHLWRWVDGKDFERWLSALFGELGFPNQVVGRTGDGGVDLVLIGRSGTRYAVQAKMRSGGWELGRAAAYEVLQGMSRYNCMAAIIVTNSTFSAEAARFARRNQVFVIDRDGIAALVMASSLLCVDSTFPRFIIRYLQACCEIRECEDELKSLSART